MSLKINESQNSVNLNSQTITDCTHLIDLPPISNTFNRKEKGADVSNPKAAIRVLTAFTHKNGLSNLL